MTDQGPATPGTAARCEVCGWLRGYGRGLCSAHIPDYYDYEISACFKRGFERLKAENASLLESLRESRDLFKTMKASSQDFEDRLAAAEKRSADLEAALREVYRRMADPGTSPAEDEAFIRAALHDEERSAPPQEGERDP